MITISENGNHIDVYPQILRGYVAETAANTYSEKAIATGVPKSVGKNKTTVMNILRIHMNYHAGPDMDSGDGVIVAISDRAHGTVMPEMSTAGCIYHDYEKYKLATSGVSYNKQFKTIPFDDGLGHGILFARSEIWLHIIGVSMGAPLVFYVMIVYNFVDVPNVEFVGIIQN